MRWALAQAALAPRSGDVPVGAVLVGADGEPHAADRNRREERRDPTAHAELLAIRAAASALGSWRLEHTTLVVTLEPCAMCAGAIVAARIPRVVFGAWDEKAGAAGSVWDLLRDRRSLHRPDVVGGVLERECADLLRTFFAGRR